MVKTLSAADCALLLVFVVVLLICGMSVRIFVLELAWSSYLGDGSFATPLGLALSMCHLVLCVSDRKVVCRIEKRVDKR